MRDIHCHILPGVDDGSDSLEDSLLMAKQAVESGTSTIIATPHFGGKNKPEDLLRFVSEWKRLRVQLRRNSIPLELQLGCELYTTLDILPLLERKLVLTLNKTKYLLMEFDFDIDSRNAERLIAEVADLDYIPVIAHAERFHFVQRAPERLRRWMSMGYVVQLNKGSFFGAFGSDASDTAHKAIEMGCVHAVASDAHSPYRRTTKMEDARKYLGKNWFPELAELLLEENPAAISAGKKPVAARQKFPWLGEEL